ncbi:MAG: 50S ribosomal protein L23 [Parcubacteria group bacterium]|nr:50S ribosomal protein L23 [Parcubacteria group bacterium]
MVWFSKQKQTTNIKEENKTAIKTDETQTVSQFPAIKLRKDISIESLRSNLRPIISEKATNAQRDNKYIFSVASGTNKMTTKKAIEALYGVNVIKINHIHIPRRIKKTRRGIARIGACDKMVATLQKGQKIEIK